MDAVRWSAKGDTGALMGQRRQTSANSDAPRLAATSAFAVLALSFGIATVGSLSFASLNKAVAQTATPTSQRAAVPPASRAAIDKPKAPAKASRQQAQPRRQPTKNTVTSVRPRPQTGKGPAAVNGAAGRTVGSGAAAVIAPAIVAPLLAPALPLDTPSAPSPIIPAALPPAAPLTPAALPPQQERPAPALSEALQFGVYSTEMDAWLGWKNIVRRQPDMVADLVPKVMPLRADAPQDGHVLLALPMPDLEPRYVCRRITGAGGSCMVVERSDLGGLETGPSGVPDADEGIVTYTVEQSKEMVEIERHASRLSTMSTIIPGSTLRIDIGALKANRWNLCALTFDDGPHGTVTPRILDILRTEKVRATFFPIASVGRRFPRILDRIVQEGHELANHSLTHPNLRNMAPEAQRAEVAEANRILAGSGSEPTLFRPPFGRYNRDTLNILEQEGMTPILWNVDTRDWHSRDRAKIVEQVKEAAAIGSVVLMHMTYTATAEALPESIAILRSRGCRFVTVSEWIASLDSLAKPHIAQR